MEGRRWLAKVFLVFIYYETVQSFLSSREFNFLCVQIQVPRGSQFYSHCQLHQPVTMAVDIAKLIETHDFRAAEDASWLATTCDTSLADGKMEHYDQVVAISQGMINFALKKMHERIPDIANFDGSNSGGSGMISAELEPPKILINTEDRNTVSWRTTFKTGTLVYKTENADDAYYPIDGWSVDTEVPLVMADFTDKPGDSQRLKDYNKKQRDWIANCFQLPGDYRPERLYAKFADARWGNFRFVGRSFVVNGIEEDYPVWRQDNLNNAKVANAFESVFKDIWTERQMAGLTTIGTKFNLDNPANVARPALYPPVTMVHQGYPYRMPAVSGAPPEWQKGVTSFEDPGSRNCLLYCENTTKRDMKQRYLGVDGNFATFGSATSKPEDPSGRVEGTFSLSHQLFFERFLLPNLQAFVKASEVFPEEPKLVYKDSNTNYSITQPYNIGAHGDWPYPGPEDDIYKFKLVVDPEGDGTTMCYQATVPNSRDTPLNFNERGNNWNKLWSDGTPTVTVRWKRGGTRITIDAKTLYQEHITTSNHQKVDPGSHQLVPAINWSHVTHSMTWGMTIDAQAVGGDIQFALNTTDKPVTVVSGDDMNGWHWEIAGTTQRIKEQIESSVKEHVGTLKEALKAGFEGQLKFHYPGDGQLVFLKSMFNNRGDFIASIKYADMPPPDPNNPIIIPAHKTELPPPKHVDPSRGETSGTSNGGAPRLEWVGNSPVQASPPKPTPPAPPAPGGTGSGQPATGSGQPATGSGQPATGSGQPATGAGQPSQPTPDPPAPVDRRIVISMAGRNTTNVTQYFSKLTLNLQGNAKILDTLLAAAKFVLGRSSSQDEVEITTETSSNVTELSSGLATRAISPHMTVCDVVLTPKSGKIIAVPPGGSITVFAKGVSGAKSSKYYKVIVTEGWCNAQGERTPGALDQFKAQVPFQLA
ncbi:hypothetical protein B0T21DRAFT_377299 [Apiosordaria backusii]|uniref:Uncharacterized protein n=1 Tax=Apiosordaria backusii TaxID=314023 RepID=A0AA40DL28_9PEZI|nr:hypothetical protein B0T21DRAFT_377299 [Apiosordaria backusii]